MTRDEIREKVLKLLSHHFGRGGKPLALTDSTALDELNIDSARMIDIVLELEDEFSVDISESDNPKIKSVGEIVTIIDNLLNVKNTKQ